MEKLILLEEFSPLWFAFMKLAGIISQKGLVLDELQTGVLSAETDLLTR